jgi:aminoglycoside phosphotransferase (APT) family kinase protein
LEPGAVIRKKYEILSEIGRGGMGVVYRARHLIWNEEKALKVLVASVSEGQPGLKSLMAEALVMRQLQHPHIVRVEDADYTEDDQPFVVMEYVEGQSLRQKLDREGPLAPRACIADRRADVLGVVGCAPKGDHSPGYQASEPAAGQERGRQRDSEGHRFRDRESARGSRTGLHGHDDRHDWILRGHARVRVA